MYPIVALKRCFSWHATKPAPYRPDPRSWAGGSGLYAVWIGHSTVLLQLDGFRILTDPMFSARCGLDLGFCTLGPKRLIEPMLSLSALPPIDLILLSHAHMDHFDRPSLRQLQHSYTDVVTASRTIDLLEDFRYRSITALFWGGSAKFGPVKITACAVKHWGKRHYFDDDRRGCNGYWIQTDKYCILFVGDSGQCHIEPPARIVDLAILPIGAYDPWVENHCTPEQAWEIAREVGAQQVMPVHHWTFQLGREPKEDPIQRLGRAAGRELSRIRPFLAISTWAI